MIKKLLFISFLFISIIGFSQEKSIDKLVATPNPLVTNTTIKFESNNNQDVYLSVRNVLGKTVFRRKIASRKGVNSFYFERGNLKSGMYIYTIQTGKERLSKRFVIR